MDKKIVLLAKLILFFSIINIYYRTEAANATETVKNTRINIIKAEENEVSGLSDNIDDILFGYKDYNQYSILSEITKTTISLQPNNISESDIILVEFDAYTNGKGAQELIVSFGNSAYTVHINTLKKHFCMPFTGSTYYPEIVFELNKNYFETTISDVKIVNYHNNLSRVENLRIGIFSDYEYKTESIDYTGQFLDRVNACLVNGDYLYTINSGTLRIFQKSESHYVEISKLGGLGTTRDMELSGNKNALVITSRRNGVYIVDVSDPEKPVLASRYDALEYSSGLFINGNYAFICDRFFGIEIIDISDITNPIFVNQIRGDNEYQDCFFDNGFLYVGIYQGKRLDIWDLRDLGNPVLASQIPLDGFGQGCFVENGYLYAATGLRSRNSDTDFYDFGRGTGNGFEIYDVHDPYNPEWISTTKTEGRMYYNSSDIWDIVVQNQKAYLSSQFGGLYIYDVKDPVNPVLLKNIDFVAKKGTDNFNEYNLNTYIFPYDAAEETHGIVNHCILGDKRLFVVTGNMGLFIVEDDQVNPMELAAAYPFTRTNKEYTVPEFEMYNAKRITFDSQIWTIKKYEDKYVVAAGKNGILLLDSDFQIIDQYKTKRPCREVEVYDSFVFSGECEGGIGIYSLDGGKITKISNYKESRYNVCYEDLGYTADGAYLIAETAQRLISAIDVRNKQEPKLVDLKEMGISRDIGLLYYRHVTAGLINDKYVGISGSQQNYYFWSNDGKLELYKSAANEFDQQNNGTCALKGYNLDGLLQVGKNRYYYRNIEQDFLGKGVKPDNYKFVGKCIVQNNILVISTVYKGDIMIVDISDFAHPNVIESVKIDGNPDVALIDKDRIIIPCRNFGLLILDKK